MNDDPIGVDQYHDRTLRCVDCTRDFNWTAKGQADFAALGYRPPKRCPECRRKRQRQNEQEAEHVIGAFDGLDNARKRHRRGSDHAR